MPAPRLRKPNVDQNHSLVTYTHEPIKVLPNDALPALRSFSMLHEPATDKTSVRTSAGPRGRTRRRCAGRVFSTHASRCLESTCSKAADLSHQEEFLTNKLQLKYSRLSIY
jgi:hypothetical protein